MNDGDDGTQIIEFTGHIALVIRWKYWNEMVRMCNTVFEMVRNWITGIGLKLANHIADALLISSRKKMVYITLTGDQVPRSDDWQQAYV